jgi:CRP-like cAMP-binding protein
MEQDWKLRQAMDALDASDSLENYGNLPPDMAELARTRTEHLDLPAGAVLLREGEHNNRLYLIRAGEMDVVKRSTGGDQVEHRIAVLGPGERIGEISVADGSPASATVRARTRARLDVLNFDGMEQNPRLLRLHDILLRSMVKNLAQRLRKSSQLTTETLASELRLQRLRGTIARFIVVMLTLFSLYAFFLRAVHDLGAYSWVSVFGSPAIIVMFALAVIYMIRTSPLPRRLFGLTTRSAVPAVRDALVWTALFLVALTALKVLAVTYLPEHQGQPIFTLAQAFTRENPNGTVNWAFYLGALGLYAMLCPAQELIGRCGVQAPLYEFMEGSETKRHVLAILISNLIASAAHVHLGMAMALVTFVPGLFWGWLFMRHRSIVSVSVSHALIGGYAIFALGIENFLT